MNFSEVYLQTILEKSVRNAFPKTISLLSAEQRKHTDRLKDRKTTNTKKRKLQSRQRQKDPSLQWLCLDISFLDFLFLLVNCSNEIAILKRSNNSNWVQNISKMPVSVLETEVSKKVTFLHFVKFEGLKRSSRPNQLTNTC